MTGWAEGSGGSLLGDLIAAAYYRAEQRDRDNEPCEKCGGDRLRTDFTGANRCHAPRAGIVGQEGEKR
ncbi:hypothetical protein ACI7YT_12380 [Microbacterium sp. M]|uniref:hypothetical protein n=1 Tax=Microbacterium sp. M TaxID=3377125 RepID=UPI00386CBE13